MSSIDLSAIKAIAFDFDGVFTDDRVLVSETGEEHVFCSRSDGLGIGMFQCRKIIEAHGGSISVESQPGNGTRFTILVPLGTKPPPNQAPP